MQYCKCHIEKLDQLYKQISQQMQITPVKWDAKNRCLKCQKRVYHQVRKQNGKIDIWGYLRRKIKERKTP